MLTFDPDGLTSAQRDGEACVVCLKRWPRPRVRVGQLRDNHPVYACGECADLLEPSSIPRPRRSRAALP
nr:hypothetical protein [Rhizohabitans arisaemae]